jgi:hypothetical protein
VSPQKSTDFRKYVLSGIRRDLTSIERSNSSLDFTRPCGFNFRSSLFFKLL